MTARRSAAFSHRGESPWPSEPSTRATRSSPATASSIGVGVVGEGERDRGEATSGQVREGVVPVGKAGPRRGEDRAHADLDRASVQRVGAAWRQQYGVEAEGGAAAEDRADIGVVDNVLEHQYLTRAVEHLVEGRERTALERGERATVHVEAGDLLGQRLTDDVAALIEVTDPDDPRLADYRDLRDVQLRTHLEAEHGLFLAEGEKVVRRAVEAGFTPAVVPDGAALARRARPTCSTPADAPCYVVSEALAEQVTGFHVHRGALASLERRPLPTLDEVLAGARQVLVLEDVVDHTNVGAIFRCGAAFGFDAVLLAPRCADPLYRRSVKVGMGAVFTTPWTRLPDWYDALPDLVRPRLHHRRAHPGRRRRRRSRRPSPGWTGWRWCSAPRATGCRRAGSSGRPAGGDPDARGHRLAQRRRRHRRGLLRHRPRR